MFTNYKGCKGKITFDGRRCQVWVGQTMVFMAWTSDECRAFCRIRGIIYGV